MNETHLAVKQRVGFGEVVDHLLATNLAVPEGRRYRGRESTET